MSTLIQPKEESIHWGDVARSFNSLIWFDTIISFVFRFMAKVSEPLLAAGVIISAIDFLQRGQLLAHNPSLSLWWSVAQGVAMEVSIGPVLMNALDAREDGDTVKMRFYAVLSAVLAIVGSAMLLMQFGLSVAGLTESQIVPWLLWTLFAIRTVASIGYIALSCTKHKRFSGVSPKMVIAQATSQFDATIERLTLMHHESMQSFMAEVNTQLVQHQATSQAQLERVTQQLDSQLVHLQSCSQEQLQSVQSAMIQELDARLSTVNQELASEVQTVKSVLATLQSSTPSVVAHKPKASTSQTPRTSLTVVPSEADIEERIRTLLEEDSTLSVRVLARRANTSPSTAGKYKKRIQSA